MDIYNIPWSEIETAEKKPGIYAWYFHPPIGDSDREDPESWKDLIKEYVLDHRRPVMEVEAKATLGLEFSGEIAHIPFAEDQDWSPDTTEIDLTTDLIETAIPLLGAPLYIGIAKKSIRKRLTSHKSDIEKYKDKGIGPVANRKNKSREEEADSIFASRIVDRGINVNNLSVHAVIFEPDSYTKEEIKTSLRESEYILNRIFFPILGKK